MVLAIIIRLETLISEISTYQYLRHKSLGYNVRPSPDILSHMEDMRLAALRNVGALRPLIAEVTGKDTIDIIQNGVKKGLTMSG